MSEFELLRYRAKRERGAIVGPVDDEDVEVTVILRDGSELPERGQISFLGVRVDEATSTVVLRATLPNPEGRVRPGQFVHVTLEGLTRPGVVVVPKQAVVHTPTAASVYVASADADGTLRADLRFVTLGVWHRNGWVVEDGLEAGDLVVVDNVMRVAPGRQLTIDGRLVLDDFETTPAPEAHAPAFQGRE